MFLGKRGFSLKTEICLFYCKRYSGIRAKPAGGPLAAVFHLSSLHIEMQKYNNETGRQNNLAKLFLCRPIRHIEKLRAKAPKGGANNPGFAAPKPGFVAPKPGFENPKPNFEKAHSRRLYSGLLHAYIIRFSTFQKMFQPFSGY